ncbi:MAG: hypothetical protein RR499_03075 [Mucinivorans sp.]
MTFSKVTILHGSGTAICRAPLAPSGLPYLALRGCAASGLPKLYS